MNPAHPLASTSLSAQTLDSDSFCLGACVFQQQTGKFIFAEAKAKYFNLRDGKEAKIGDKKVPLEVKLFFQTVANLTPEMALALEGCLPSMLTQDRTASPDIFNSISQSYIRSVSGDDRQVEFFRDMNQRVKRIVLRLSVPEIEDLLTDESRISGCIIHEVGELCRKTFPKMQAKRSEFHVHSRFNHHFRIDDQFLPSATLQIRLQQAADEAFAPTDALSDDSMQSAATQLFDQIENDFYTKFWDLKKCWTFVPPNAESKIASVFDRLRDEIFVLSGDVCDFEMTYESFQKMCERKQLEDFKKFKRIMLDDMSSEEPCYALLESDHLQTPEEQIDLIRRMLKTSPKLSRLVLEDATTRIPRVIDAIRDVIGDGQMQHEMFETVHYSNDCRFMEIFMDHGFDINAPSASRKHPLVHLTIKGEIYPTNLDRLLSAGADPDVRYSDNQTPLHKVVVWGNIQVLDTFYNLSKVRGDIAFIRTLLKGGADVNACDDEGQTPLHKAYAELGRLLRAPCEDVLKLKYDKKKWLYELLSNEISRKTGENAQDVKALLLGHQRDVIQELILNGADENAKDIEGRLPSDMQ